MSGAADGLGANANRAATANQTVKSPINADFAITNETPQPAPASCNHKFCASSKAKPASVTPEPGMIDPTHAGAQWPTSGSTNDSAIKQRAEDAGRRSTGQFPSQSVAGPNELAPVVNPATAVTLAATSAIALADDPGVSAATANSATSPIRPENSTERATMKARSEQGAASCGAKTSQASPAQMPGNALRADPPETDPTASGGSTSPRRTLQSTEPARSLAAQTDLSPTVGRVGLPARPTNVTDRARALAKDSPIGGVALGQAAAPSSPAPDGAGPLASSPTFDPGTTALDEAAQGWAAPLAHELSALLAEGAPRSARLKLHPPALGEVALAVDLRADSVRATLTVATPAAHAMLTAGLGLLADAVSGSGLRLDSLTVALGDTGAGTSGHGDAKPPRNGPGEPSSVAASPNATVLDGSLVSSPTPNHQGRVHVYA